LWMDTAVGIFPECSLNVPWMFKTRNLTPFANGYYNNGDRSLSVNLLVHSVCLQAHCVSLHRVSAHCKFACSSRSFACVAGSSCVKLSARLRVLQAPDARTLSARLHVLQAPVARNLSVRLRVLQAPVALNWAHVCVCYRL
jgi:hypothetical protein